MNTTSPVPSILDSITSVIGQSTKLDPTVLHEPDFRGTKAWEYVNDCLDTGWVSTAGQWVNRFEEGLADFTAAAHVIAVTNGTVALRLSLHLVGVRPGDEVLVSPLSFVATANAISHLSAFPHFVDVNSSNLGLSSTSLRRRLEEIAVKRGTSLFNRETGRRLAAILPVHVFGHPANVIEVREVANEWGLPVVEDAAEALGSWRAGTHCGLVGDIGTLSFNGNKLITTGGGGALITNNSHLAKRARHLSTTAKVPHPWEFDHDFVGWNDRLPNINAALGCAQLEAVDSRLSAKRELANRYQDAFSDVKDVEFLCEPLDCNSNYWLSSICFTSPDVQFVKDQRNLLLEKSHASGLLLRPVWKLLHQLSMYQSMPKGTLSNAEDLSFRLVNLPSSPQLIES